MSRENKRFQTNTSSGIKREVCVRFELPEKEVSKNIPCGNDVNKYLEKWKISISVYLEYTVFDSGMISFGRVE